MKVEEETIVKLLEDVALSPLTETVIGPLAAPLGMTNERLVAVKLDTGAGTIPPPCALSVTWGAPPFDVKLVPVTVTSEPSEAELGLNPLIVGGGTYVTWMDCAV